VQDDERAGERLVSELPDRRRSESRAEESFWASAVTSSSSSPTSSWPSLAAATLPVPPCSSILPLCRSEPIVIEPAGEGDEDNDNDAEKEEERDDDDEDEDKDSTVVSSAAEGGEENEEDVSVSVVLEAEQEEGGDVLGMRVDMMTRVRASSSERGLCTGSDALDAAHVAALVLSAEGAMATGEVGDGVLDTSAEEHVSAPERARPRMPTRSRPLLPLDGELIYVWMHTHTHTHTHTHRAWVAIANTRRMPVPTRTSQNPSK